jgi:hypothetical protein
MYTGLYVHGLPKNKGENSLFTCQVGLESKKKVTYFTNVGYMKKLANKSIFFPYRSDLQTLVVYIVPADRPGFAFLWSK